MSFARGAGRRIKSSAQVGQMGSSHGCLAYVSPGFPAAGNALTVAVRSGPPLASVCAAVGLFSQGVEKQHPTNLDNPRINRPVDRVDKTCPYTVGPLA